MGLQLWPYSPMRQRNENDLYAFSPDKLECWNEIAISRYDDNRPHEFPERQSGHVQSNPHVDTLLGDVEHEIAVTQGSGRRYESCDDRGPQVPWRRIQSHLTHAKGEAGLHHQAIKQALRMAKTSGSSEIEAFPGYRLRHRFRRWMSVVVVNPQQFIRPHLTELFEAVAEGDDIRRRCRSIVMGLDLLGQKSAIQKHGEQGFGQCSAPE